MATTASLAQLLSLQNKLNFYTQEQIKYSNLLDANSSKLSKQTKYEENWNKEYDKAQDSSRSSALKMNGNIFLDKEVAGTDAQAFQWAEYKVEEYDAELLLELADLDMDYDSMKTMYDTLMEETRAQVDGLKQLVSTEATDTHTIGQ